MNVEAVHEGTLTRHTRNALCPVCGGHAGLPQGKGVRCAGFTLNAVVYCTREEYAGSLPIELSASPPAYKHRRFGTWGCGKQHGWGSVVQTTVAIAPRAPLAADVRATRDEVYRSALERLALRDEARLDLTGRGLTVEVALAWGYRSIPRKGSEQQRFIESLGARFGEAALRACPGFTDKNGRLSFWTAAGARDGYVVPYRDEDGRITGLQCKLLGGRYLNPPGMQIRDIYAVAGAAMPGCDLFVTEGATKAVVANHVGGLAVFAIPGQALQPEHAAAIERLRPRRVIVALDEEDNRNTDRARERWCEMLHDAGLAVARATWEGSGAGGPKGLDDLIAAGGRPRIRAVTLVPKEMTRRRDVRPAAEPGDVTGGASLAAVRDRVQVAIDAFVERSPQHRGEALCVVTPPGTAKKWCK